MRLLRIQNLCWLVAFATHGSAITLLQVLQSYSDLSTLYSYINGSSNLTSLVSNPNSNNFTFLAASNDAISSFIVQNPNTLTADLLEATLQYSLLKGGYPTLSFSNTPQFVASNLVNATYANVTGGQAVELGLDSSGTPQIVSGNRSISTSTSTDIVCVGGIIHIVNEVLAVPTQVVLEITSARLEYFISILNTGGYLSTANAVYVNAVLDAPDLTYFIPNSAGALANFTALAQNSTPAELQAVFEYHVVPNFVGYSTLLKDGMSLKTLQGTNVTITIQDGDMYVNSALVTTSDYIVGNGVVHVIDTLLNSSDTSPPPKPTPSTVATSSPAPTATPTAITAATATPTHAASSKSPSSGAKVGIGIGVTLAGLLTIAALTWFFLRSRKRKRDSGLWDDQSMSAGTNDIGKFYVQRGQVQRQEDLGLGLQSTGMHRVQSVQEGDSESKSPVEYSPTVRGGPSIPPRSPSRLTGGQEFF